MSAPEIEYIETDNEYIQLNQSEVLEGEDGDDTWDSSSITLLLNLYLQNITKFRNPKVRKKNIWMDISNSIGKSPESCDKKFRNLKQTYIRVLKKKNRNGFATVKWPYFEIFEEIYNINGEYQPEIQQKIVESSTVNVAKALLSMNPETKYCPEDQDTGESSRDNESRDKLKRKRYTEFRKMTTELRDRQRMVEEKLDRLINIVEESNNIQRDRNKLFEQFLQKLN